MNKKHKILISGGGTGGHIFPAVAIANEIRKQKPDSEILFVGALGRMEMEKVPKSGYKIKGLWISGIERKLSFKNLVFPIKLIKSIWDSFFIIREFKPDIAIGTGGFASGVALFVSSMMGIPIVIQEQNSYPGITNKILSKLAKKIFVAYDGLDSFFEKNKISNTGNPVREDIFENLPTKKEALEYFALDPNKKTVLSVGGSLGARAINESWMFSQNEVDKNNFQVILQSGKLDFTNLQSQIKSKNIKVVEFITQMKMAYTAADIIVSRAGAIAISEICITKKPTILVPYPFASGNHQMKNAKSLEIENAAVLIENKNCKTELIGSIIELLNDVEKTINLSKNIGNLAKINATKNIVTKIFEIIK